MEGLLDLLDGNGLILLEGELAGIETLLGNHHLGQSLGIRHNVELRIKRIEFGEDFCAKDLGGCIALGILDGTTIAGGEEQHVLIAHELGEIVIEIACLLSIL